MTIETRLKDQEQILVIRVDSRFDYGKVQEFRDAYAELPYSVKEVQVDLAETEYMDSSALGMLLNMQKSLSERERVYKIINCRPQVARILAISRFDKKFSIE